MEHYKRTELLGQGTYGKVYKAQHIHTGKVVALKKTILSKDDEGVPATTLREVSILRSLDSPYVVKLEEVVHTDGGSGRPLLFLVFEYLDHDLKQYMHTRHGKGRAIPHATARRFAYQILLGLQHCHANAVMHRDLKPQNLLVEESTGTIKLADFGLGRVFSLPVAKYTHEVVTLWYRAPEILLGTKQYSTAVDIWSVGCILGEMLLGRAMFCGECELEQLLAIFRILGTPTSETWPTVKSLRDWHTYPEWSPTPLKDGIKWPTKPDDKALDLLQLMLVCDPAKRITTMDAIRHPYFDDIRADYPTPVGAHLVDSRAFGANKENENMQ